MPTREFDCQSAGCQFMIRSENEDELISLVQDHAKESHDQDMSSSAIRDVWTTA